MDFLLECIGFPPKSDLAALAARVLEDGEPVAWRGPSGVHLRYPLAGGLEVRLDREDDQDHWSLWPHYDTGRRLRVAVRSLTAVPDSPFDVLMTGIANPPAPQFLDPEAVGDDYAIATYLSDARRIPTTIPVGHVLAVSIAGFALDVDYVGPNEGVRQAEILDEPCGAFLVPVGGTPGDGHPGGAMDLSLRVRGVRHLSNPLSGQAVEVIEVDAPGRPLELFVSRWQLESEGLEVPRPGWRIEGAFLFTGRVAGGLPSSQRKTGRHFG